MCMIRKVCIDHWPREEEGEAMFARRFDSERGATFALSEVRKMLNMLLCETYLHQSVLTVNDRYRGMAGGSSAVVMRV